MTTTPSFGLNREQSLNLLRSGRYSDFTIKCEDKSFPVHKFMLAAKSRFFNAVIDGPFKEGESDELTFQETNPLAVATIIAYLYTGDSHCAHVAQDIWPDKITCEDTCRLSTLLSIYTLSERLMLEPLKRAVIPKAVCELSSYIEVLKTAGDGNLHDHTYDLVNLVYSNLAPTDDLLRPSITKLLLKVEDEDQAPMSLFPIISRTAPIVIPSDSETDDNSSVHSDETAGEGESEIESDSDGEEELKELRVAVSFESTLKRLMTLAEQEDGSAVACGRLILHENRQKIRQLGQKYQQLAERVERAERTEKEGNQQRPAKRQRRN